MAKPFIDESGNGFRLHYSLWSEGKNIFADAGKLNDLGRHFPAACSNAWPRPRLRRGHGECLQASPAPVLLSGWGLDNRTVALRVIEGSDSAVRIEKRDAGADCNPIF